VPVLCALPTATFVEGSAQVRALPSYDRYQSEGPFSGWIQIYSACHPSAGRLLTELGTK